jgi:hypothetical protein
MRCHGSKCPAPHLLQAAAPPEPAFAADVLRVRAVARRPEDGGVTIRGGGAPVPGRGEEAGPRTTGPPGPARPSATDAPASFGGLFEGLGGAYDPAGAAYGITRGPQPSSPGPARAPVSPSHPALGVIGGARPAMLGGSAAPAPASSQSHGRDTSQGQAQADAKGVPLRMQQGPLYYATAGPLLSESSEVRTFQRFSASGRPATAPLTAAAAAAPSQGPAQRTAAQTLAPQLGSGFSSPRSPAGGLQPGAPRSPSHPAALVVGGAGGGAAGPSGATAGPASSSGAGNGAEGGSAALSPHTTISEKRPAPDDSRARAAQPGGLQHAAGPDRVSLAAAQLVATQAAAAAAHDDRTAQHTAALPHKAPSFKSVRFSEQTLTQHEAHPEPRV